MSYPERELSSPSRPSARSEINRFLGGSPFSVAFRLILLSILVGVVLSTIGFDPYNIIDSIQALIRVVWNMGYDAIEWMWRYFLLGAAVVIPIWLIVRLTSGWR